MILCSLTCNYDSCFRRLSQCRSELLIAAIFARLPANIWATIVSLPAAPTSKPFLTSSLSLIRCDHRLMLGYSSSVMPSIGGSVRTAAKDAMSAMEYLSLTKYSAIVSSLSLGSLRRMRRLKFTATFKLAFQNTEVVIQFVVRSVDAVVRPFGRPDIARFTSSAECTFQRRAQNSHSCVMSSLAALYAHVNQSYS